MKAKHRYIWANIKLVCTIVPIVLVMIIVYFMLVRREILSLSKEKLTLESNYYVEEISAWAESVLNEVTIYKNMIERLGLENDAIYELMYTSVDSHEAYPFGLYMGDDQGNYFDASGWEPGEDFVVTERDWYKEGLLHDQFAFGEPYVDSMTGGTCVSISSRLKAGSAVTVLSADVYLDYASQLAEEIASDKIEHAFFVTAGSRLILADSDASMVGTTLSAEHESMLYQNVNRLLDTGKPGQYDILGDESVYFVNITAIPDTDWYFITCMNRNEVLKDLWGIEFPMLLIAVIASVLLFFLTSLFSKEMSSIRTKARLDPLTRLLNREGFEELVRMALAERPGQGLMMIMDMDNFKLINDQLGHPVGDNVLRKFSSILENYFNRNKDIVGRLGGDEFAVFVGRDISTKETEGMLKKFISIVHQNFDSEYPDQKLSASIGVGLAANNNTYELLYQNADKALYEAKWNGKDRFQIK
ncbi:MAG: sensor domain-containing diguanylate cyclase [Lachnospiraceae bacterium]|mgnify:FL=1|nr:sensor domain-containing diguanylate cyclase [Lachnospiraceae bacterium]